MYACAILYDYKLGMKLVGDTVLAKSRFVNVNVKII